jgi:hypothetical protein
MTAAVPVLLGALAIIGAVGASICWFIVRAEQRSYETDAERAYRWREEMRAKSHDRQYR